MPKGQYTRKPRTVEPETMKPVMDEGTRPLPPLSEEELVANAMNNPFWRSAEASRVTQAEQPLVLPSETAPPAEPARETYDDWMDEDERPTINNPADAIVHSKVGQWAGSICKGWHQVVWAPADNGEAIEVTLTTDHGVTILKQPAGNWTEADVDAALAQMRSDLRV